MKIVISSTGRKLESDLDATFHRCHFFLIIDTKTNSLKSLENTTRENSSEIGAIVGQIISNEGIDNVITTNIGPRAFDIFKQYGIKIYQAQGKVNDAIKQIKKGKLPEITKSTITK